jgi:hypothetical protein
MAVKIRGIYATALTERLSEVVQPSAAIADRVEEPPPMDPAAALVETTTDRQGIGVHGDPDRVAGVAERAADIGRDALQWSASLPAGGVYAGDVTETLGSGALVDVGDGTGFLPYGTTSRRIETGDRLRVQVTEPAPPWVDERPVLDTTLRVRRGLLELVRGGAVDARGPTLVDVLPADPPAGWGPIWADGAEAESHETLAGALETISTVADDLDEALEGVSPPAEAAPGRYWAGDATTWVWFGREARFALDEARAAVTSTRPGHHRLKAGTETASAAVDFAETVCDATNGAFPFDVATRQFGPREGDTIAIGHGKPDGRRLNLGPGEVVERDPEGSVTIEREMSPGGTYDALGVERAPGDVAVTEVTEGRWWYPTVYRSETGERRGTYVNVCTPVEIFPEAVRYVDLHVDVVKHADGTIERVDDDELDAAVAAGHVPEPLAARARAVASAVESAL